MSYIETLMIELDLNPGTIQSTLTKIEEACNGYEITSRYHKRLIMSGNGDGDN